MTDEFRIRHHLAPPGMADFRATREPSLIILAPLNDRSEHWLREKCDNESMWMADAVIVEPRYFGSLAETIMDAGFTFERG